jgi:alpha-glucosidase
VIGLAHRQPVSHPFEIRYSKSDIERISHPSKIEGTITTPWRVVLVGDLDAMVNNDVIMDLCPPPDKKIFPQGVPTPWVKPGRAVWRYLDTDPAAEEKISQTAGDVIPRGAEATRGTSAPADMRGPSGRYRSLRDDIAPRTDRQPATSRRSRNPVTPQIAEWYSHAAGKLGFEFNVLEGYWRRWSDEQLREVVDDAQKQQVKLFVWLNSKDLHEADARHKLFDHLRDLGVAGLKIDFFDHEHKEMIDLYEAIRRETAQRHLLVNFHGANKLTGEERTWPNEINREAIHGMESRSIKDRATHDTTLPFTRFLAGPADYTPVLFTDRRANTTIAHQVATACVFTETLLTYASNPQKLLDSPAVEMIKSIPATWDQTIVLPGSEIGQCAAFARRSGKTWFVAVLNGTQARTLDLPLDFLGTDRDAGEALIVSDDPGNPSGIKVQTIPMKQFPKKIALAPGGGWIARFNIETQRHGEKE